MMWKKMTALTTSKEENPMGSCHQSGTFLNRISANSGWELSLCQTFFLPGKTFGSLKNRRLPHTVTNHAVSQFRITQIGVLLYQCLHALNMLQTTSGIKVISG